MGHGYLLLKSAPKMKHEVTILYLLLLVDFPVPKSFQMSQFFPVQTPENEEFVA
jgi:hypothetical protein